MLARADLAHAAGRAIRGSTGPRNLLQQLHQLRSARHACYTPNAASTILRRHSTPLLLRFFATAPATNPTRAKPAKRTAAPKKHAGASASKRKPAAKKTAAKKPKKRAVKAKPKPKKKALTERQLAAQAKKKVKATEQKGKDQLLALRQTALLDEEPKRALGSAWTAYCSENLGNDAGVAGTQAAKFKELGPRYKQLPPAEIERLNHKVVEIQENYEKAYKKWVSSHTPAEVRAANKARATLKRLASKSNTGATKKKVRQSFSPIRDERLPKQPIKAFFFFLTERRESGDFKNITVGDASKLIAEEWKDFGAAAKKKYEDLGEADAQRYRREYKAAFGEDYAPKKKTVNAAA